MSDSFETSPYDVDPAYTEPLPPVDWSTVAADSTAHMENYDVLSDTSWALYNASTEASLAGDGYEAYLLNTASLEAQSLADDSWSDAGQVWTDASAYETAASQADTSYVDTSWDTSTTDTSYVDTSYVDTSWDTTTTDTSWDTTSYDTGLE